MDDELAAVFQLQKKLVWSVGGRWRQSLEAWLVFTYEMTSTLSPSSGKNPKEVSETHVIFREG